MTRRFKVGQMVRYKKGVVENAGYAADPENIDMLDAMIIPTMDCHMPARIWKIDDFGDGSQHIYLDIPDLRDISCNPNGLELVRTRRPSRSK